ncbi:uncharacterized protein LOC108713857 [Xenopus laevis]|uniref:Uncharacterized protein LOC108713857 n=1 Tax=Xenopus laevis TaxID=8355 RepID=A0A8J1MX29_XENLA|nr:uncharacterized protein LOC108713857 [Xenopus laevis]
MKKNLKKYTLIAEKYYEIFDETVGIVVEASKISKRKIAVEEELLKTYKQFNEALDEMDKRGSFPTSSLDEVPGKIRENLLSLRHTFKATLSEMRRKAELSLLENGITPKKEEIEENTTKPPDADNKEDVANPNYELFLNIKNLKKSLKMNRLLGERYYEIFEEKVTNLTTGMQTIDNDTIDNLAALYVEYKEELDEARKSGSISSYRLYDLPVKMKANVVERHKIFTEAMDELERRGLDEIRKHLPPTKIEEDEMSENSASGRAITGEEGEEKKEETKKEEPKRLLFDIRFERSIILLIGCFFCLLYFFSHMYMRWKKANEDIEQGST